MTENLAEPLGVESFGSFNLSCTPQNLPFLDPEDDTAQEFGQDEGQSAQEYLAPSGYRADHVDGRGAGGIASS
jgi:hypothetical protein